MGLIDSLNEASEHAHAVRLVRKSLTSKHFTLDTNIFVVLAKEGNVDLLNDIANAPNFVFVDTNDRELYGLIHGNHTLLNQREKHILETFRAQLQKKRPARTNVGTYENLLRPLTDLLPRKLVHDIMISSNDSFVRKLLKRFIDAREKKRDDSAFLLQLQKEFERDVKSLPHLCRVVFSFRCKKIGINEQSIDTARCFADIDKFIQVTLREIKEIVARNHANLQNIISNLESIAQKEYRADIKFVAETLEHAATGASLDSDVITLMELHSAGTIR